NADEIAKDGQCCPNPGKPSGTSHIQSKQPDYCANHPHIDKCPQGLIPAQHIDIGCVGGEGNGQQTIDDLEDATRQADQARQTSKLETVHVDSFIVLQGKTRASDGGDSPVWISVVYLLPRCSQGEERKTNAPAQAWHSPPEDHLLLL